MIPPCTVKISCRGFSIEKISAKSILAMNYVTNLAEIPTDLIRKIISHVDYWGYLFLTCKQIHGVICDTNQYKRWNITRHQKIFAYGSAHMFRPEFKVTYKDVEIAAEYGNMSAMKYAMKTLNMSGSNLISIVYIACKNNQTKMFGYLCSLLSARYVYDIISIAYGTDNIDIICQVPLVTPARVRAALYRSLIDKNFGNLQYLSEHYTIDITDKELMTLAGINYVEGLFVYLHKLGARFIGESGAIIMPRQELHYCLSEYDEWFISNEDDALDLIKYFGAKGSDLSYDDYFVYRWAIRRGYIHALEYLAHENASVDNTFAASLAVEYGHSHVIEYLLGLFTPRNDQVIDLIVLACELGRLEIVKCLVEHNDVDTCHEHAIRAAKAYSRYDIVQYLRTCS